MQVLNVFVYINTLPLASYLVDLCHIDLHHLDLLFDCFITKLYVYVGSGKYTI